MGLISWLKSKFEKKKEEFAVQVLEPQKPEAVKPEQAQDEIKVEVVKQPEESAAETAFESEEVKPAEQPSAEVNETSETETSENQVAVAPETSEAPQPEVSEPEAPEVQVTEEPEPESSESQVSESEPIEVPVEEPRAEIEQNVEAEVDLKAEEAASTPSDQATEDYYKQAEAEATNATPFEFHPVEKIENANSEDTEVQAQESESEVVVSEPSETTPSEPSEVTENIPAEEVKAEEPEPVEQPDFKAQEQELIQAASEAVAASVNVPEATVETQTTENPDVASNQSTEEFYKAAEDEASKAEPFEFTPSKREEEKAPEVPAKQPEVSAAEESQAPETEEPEPEVSNPSEGEEKKPKGNADQLDDLALYNLGLGKAREGFSHRLNRLAKKYKEANADYFDELEECLIEADVGVDLALRVLDTTETMAAQQHISDTSKINDLLVDNMFMDYARQGSSYRTDVDFDPSNPTVLMIVGVNGTGKTTTIAKLALRYKEQGKKVLLVAADTFRAGAVEQLRIWADRVGVDCYDKGMGAEPASVCFDAVHKAVNEKYDLVIVDTAGRLHTKDYLMAELGKLVRVIGKIIPDAPQEVWLALDANTGQNGVQQSKVFKEVCHLTGIVITKMDGTSKGGIILAIRDQLGIPVRFIGLGEQEHDLREFDLAKYLYGLLVGGEE